jgi:hypothetical protein
MPKHIWTDDMVAFVADAYQRHSYQECADLVSERFGVAVTAAQILALTKNRKLRSGRTRGDIRRGKSKLFTPEQQAFIREQYPLLSRKELTAALNQRWALGVTLEQVVAYVKNNGVNSGRTGYFPKGTTPFNAGTKGVMKANSGSWKRGNRPQTWKPVGTIAIETKDRFLKIKVAEPNKWVFLHRQIWEHFNGPVPAGHVVHLMDANKFNVDISNLELVSRSEMAVRNHSGLGNVPPELKPLASATARLRMAAAAARRSLKNRKAA